MKRLLVLFLSAVAVMFVSAWTPTVDMGVKVPVDTAGVEFNDTGFDYYAKDYGYIHLLREGNVVIVRLNDIPEGGLKLSYTKAFDEFFDKYGEPTDEAKQFSRDTLQAKAGLDIGQRTSGINITFTNTTLETAKKYFLDQFVTMSFKPVEAVRTANTLAFDCGCTVNADVHVRVVFTERGEDVIVHINHVE